MKFNVQTLLQIFSSLRLKCNWNFLKRSKFNYSKRIGISPKILEMGIFPKNLELFQKYWKVLDNSKLNFSKNIGLFPKNLEIFQKYWNFLRFSKLNCSNRIGIFPKNLELFQKYWNFLRNQRLNWSKRFGTFSKEFGIIPKILEFFEIFKIEEFHKNWNFSK